MSACLVTVVWGESYERYARDLFDSAEKHFPGDTLLLRGVPGWPAASLYRYHVLLAQDFSGYDYIYLCDADMRWEADAEGIFGEIVATRHPGFLRRHAFPYETRPESTACVKSGTTYYCGGFVGGEREAFLDLARKVAVSIDMDDEHGIMAVWHDESHLNRILAESPPTLTLSPSYCFPDDASGYPWLVNVPRKLVAIDKPGR